MAKELVTALMKSWKRKPPSAKPLKPLAPPKKKGGCCP